MAFFGEDGLQRQLKQAQRDLMEKDREIGTMFLSSKEKDETLKKLRLEVERLQEERNDLANSGAGTSPANGANDAAERSRLKAELKQAQDALNKACMENNKLREEARQTSSHLNDVRLRKVSASSSSTSSLSSPSSNRSSRRRSTSLSTDPRVKDLEAELTMLRQNAGSPALEVDGLKTQLANVKRELNKAINEKIAIESRAKKEVETVKSQLEDANFELDNVRRDLEDGGSISKKEVEKRQRSWEGEKAELVVKVRGLERVVAESKEEISAMKTSAADITRIHAELDLERSKTPSSSPAADASAEIARLTEEVASLQQDLVRARAHTPSSISSSSSSDLTVRRLERKLEKVQRDAEALEESLNQAEEENQALRSRVPLPGSPNRKANDGKLMELEEENEKLQNELAELRSELDVLQTQLQEGRSAQEAAEQAQKAAEPVCSDLQKGADVWTAERQTFSEQVETLRESASKAEEQNQARARDVANKEAELATISSALAISEAQIAKLNVQIESAETRRLESQAAELTSSLEAVTKERDTIVETVARLYDEISALQKALQESQDELTSDRAELAVIRIQLKEVSEQESASRTEIDDLQDRLELTTHEKLSIENTLAALQESIGDRSTESEADDRNNELLSIKRELDEAREEYKAKEQEMQQELDLLSFTKDKNAEEAQKRIARLQEDLSTAQTSLADKEMSLQALVDRLQKDLEASREEIASLESSVSSLKAELDAAKSSSSAYSGPDRLGLLYTKIQSLRSERDDLRQALSFAQNESRFTIRAAQADRESAIEELEKVKRDLDSQVAVYETLEAEISSVRTQLSEKESKLEDVKSLYAGAAFEKGDVADKIAQYESEVASAKAERDHLVAELGESHNQIMELNHAMAMMRTSTDTDKRHRKISMERKVVVEMPKITETSTGVAIDRGPISFSSSRRPGHNRTKSELASLVLPDQAQITVLTAKVTELESEIKALSGKLERRNASIAALQLDNEKLKMAEELSKESAEEFEELVVERDELQAKLEQRDGEMKALRREIETATTQLEAQTDQLKQLENTISNLHAERATGQADADRQADRLAELESSFASAHDELIEARTAAQSLEHKANLAEITNAATERIVDSQTQGFVLAVLGHRQRLSSATTAWRNASLGLTQQTTSLAAAHDQVKALSIQVDAFEAEREAMSQQLLSHTQRAKALDTANEKIHELQSQVDTFEAECVAMSEQLELNIAREKELKSQIEAGADTQRSLEEATGRAEQANRELSDTRVQISTLEQDIESARTAMVDIEAAKSHLESELTGQIDSLKAQLAQSESRASESQAELKRLEDHHERVDDGTTATEDRSHGEAKSSDGNEQTAVAHVTNLIDTLRQAAASAEKGLENERSRSAELAVQVETLNTRLDEANASATKERSAKVAEINALQASLDEMTESVQAKSLAAVNLERTCDDLRTTIITLEQQLTEEGSSSAEEVQALQSIQHDLRGQLDAALDKVEALRIQVSSIMSKNQQLTLDLSKTTTEAQTHQESLAVSEDIFKTLRGDVERLEKENQQTTGLMKYHESESQQRANKLAPLEKALHVLKAELKSSHDMCNKQKAEVSRLEAEMGGLRTALLTAQSADRGHDDSELKERIEELEASLTLKTQEVDEADDRTREAFKTNAKLEKKIAKLNRQLGDKELEANTKRNKVIAIPDPAPMQRPIAPTPTTHRAPLRQVENLEPPAAITSTPGSLKRLREGEEDQKPLPAEAIMLPPSAPTSITSKTPSRKAFTPKRNLVSGAENADLRSGARNIFGTGGIGTKPSMFGGRSPGF